MSDKVQEAVPPRKASRTSWVSWFALLAIIGIIIAVALPSYVDYTHRAQASEAIALLGAAKAPLAEYFEARRQWPDSLDKIVAATNGKYTRSVAISRGAGGAGEIWLTATMRTEGVDRRVAGQTILLASNDGGKTWTCRPGTLPAKHLPEACRN